MSHRFIAGCVLVFVGLVLLALVWALAKRDSTLHVETDTDEELDDLDQELRALMDDRGAA